MRNWSKNKRKWLLSMVVVALLGAAFHAGTVFGAGAEPGSDYAKLFGGAAKGYLLWGIP